MGLTTYQKIDKLFAKFVVLMPIVWVGLWMYQEYSEVGNDFFLAQSASFIFFVLLPGFFIFHRITMKKINAHNLPKTVKQHIARHRVFLYLLSLVMPLIVFTVYFDRIFKQTTEQNIIFGIMLILAAGGIQLTVINLFSLLMRSRTKDDPLPNVLATLGAYPVVTIPVFQSLFYFALIGG